MYAVFLCVCSYLAETTPYYYSLAVEAVGPFLEAILEKLKVVAVFIAQKSSELMLWLQESTPLLVEWVRYSPSLAIKPT